MKFTITYRKKDGSMTTEVIDASDRAACIAECRKRGIAPMAVAQGGKASSQSRVDGITIWTFLTTLCFSKTERISRFCVPEESGE